MRVKRGQTWSLADDRRGRVTVKIKSVRGPAVRAIVVRTGVELLLRRKTFDYGQRGARLLSETVRRVRSEPIVVAKPDERSEKMRRLLEEDHMTLTAIAERMGCARSTVMHRIKRARLVRRDEQAAIGAP